MLRRSAVSRSLLSVLREELAKVPAYFTAKTRETASQHVESASKTFEFLKGENPDDTPEMKEKQRKHREMYEAIQQQNRAQAEALKQRRAAAMANLSWSERAKEAAKSLKESMAEMTSTRAGAMALLQHCTASHAAEVAVEQGIDVKNVQMVLERQQKPNSVEYEEVVVGYIDAPAASDEEVMAFAEKLHKACPVANTMRIDWRHGDGQKTHGDAREEPIAMPSAGSKPVDFADFARGGMDSFRADGGEAPLGMPGSRRMHARGPHATPAATAARGASGSRSSSYRSRFSGLRDDDVDGDGFHLPGVTARQKQQQQQQQRPSTTAAGSSDGGGGVPAGMPGAHRTRAGEQKEEESEQQPNSSSQAHGTRQETTTGAATTGSPSTTQGDARQK